MSMRIACYWNYGIMMNLCTNKKYEILTICKYYLNFRTSIFSIITEISRKSAKIRGSFLTIISISHRYLFVRVCMCIFKK